MRPIKALPILLATPLLGAPLITPGSFAEKAGQEVKPVASAEARTVFLDVILKDSKDRHIKDIRPDEIAVFEDGVKQQIDSLEIHSDGGVRSILPAADKAAASQPAAESAKRVNIITFLMDVSSTTLPNQKYVREGAIKYVKEKIGPDDLVAVYAVGSGDMKPLQPFTTDKAQLLAALSKSDLTGAPAKGARAASKTKAAPEVSTGSAASGGEVAQTKDTVQLRAMLGDRLDSGFTAMRAFGDSLMARPVLTAIKSIALAEREIPGRKTLVLFSQGFPMPPDVEELMRDTADAANKSNLAIYPLVVGGLLSTDGSVQGELDGINAGGVANNRAASTGDAGGGGRGASGATPSGVDLTAVGTGGGRTGASAGESLFDRARQSGSDREESSLLFLASSTGGMPIRNTNDVAKGLARIDEDLRTYYLLSYRPANQVFDGKFRTLRVDSTRAGVKVRARNGYYATTSNDSLLTAEQDTLFTNARGKRLAPTLALYAAADEIFPEGRLPAAVVTVEVSADAIDLRENGPVSEGALNILGLVSDETGKSITTFGRSQPVKIGKDQLDSTRGGFISHSETVSLKPGNYKVEVVVNEPSTGHYGYFSKMISLNPPPGFAASDIILGHQIAKAAPDVKEDPLVIEGALVVPSATRRFRNGERLIFYFDLYNAIARGGKSDVDVALTLLKDGKPLQIKLPAYKVASPIKAATGRLQVAKFLELAGLQPGRYGLKVEAKDLNSGSTCSSETSFTLVN